MALSYLDRYLQGEHEQVYTELVSLGSVIAAGPLYSDACEVAKAMMRRAQINVKLIIARLDELCYQFKPELTRSLDTEERATLHALDAAYGPLPIIIRMWYEEVGLVDLTGDHPALSQCHNSVGPISGPLVVEFNPEMLEYQVEERAAHPAFLYPLELPFAGSRFCKTHDCVKDGDEDCAAGDMSFLIEYHGFDAPFCSGDECDGMFFIPYLRECFAWGGFPGLRYDSEAAGAAAQELAILTKDLLPI